MIVVKAKIRLMEVDEEVFTVQTRSALISLLQMLEDYQRCESYVIFDSINFEKINDVKSRFNISNTSIQKLRI